MKEKFENLSVFGAVVILFVMLFVYPLIEEFAETEANTSEELVQRHYHANVHLYKMLLYSGEEKVDSVIIDVLCQDNVCLKDRYVVTDTTVIRCHSYTNCGNGIAYRDKNRYALISYMCDGVYTKTH